MTIRTAIIGCGRVVTEAYLEAFAHAPELELVAAVDLDAARAELVAERMRKRHPWVAAHTDLDAVTGEVVDLALVVLPPVPAVAATTALLSRGCSVLAEKPLTIDPALLAELEATASGIGAWFGIVTNYRFRPDLARAITVVAEGAIGEPAWIRLHMPDSGHWPGTDGYDPHWRTKTGAMPGGVAGDKGYHLLYLAEALSGSPVTDCQWQVRRDGAGQIDTWCAQTTSANGTVASLLTSWSARGPASQVLEVHGSRGSVHIDPTMGGPLRVVRDGEPDRLITFSADDGWGYGGQLRDTARRSTKPAAVDVSGPRRWARLLSDVTDATKACGTVTVAAS